MFRLGCYGGVNDIGGNKILLNFDKGSILLDFGISFAEEAFFFEEFLQPRSASKIHDLLKLGLLPRIDGLYRKDAIRPIGFEKYDFPGKSLWDVDLRSYEEALEEDSWHPDAVFISHVHLDHCGYVPYLGDIPLLCSKTTQTLMHAIGEIGNLSGLDDQLTVLKRREMGRLGGGYFPGEPRMDYSKEPEGRDICLLKHGEDHSINNDMKITGFNVDHSIPGSMACLAETKESQVLYTGDLRFHGRCGFDLKKDLASLKPNLMICEGTRIDESEPDDEKQVEAELTELFSKHEGLAIVGFSWKDVDRYETVRDAATESGRIPVFDPRLAYLLARIGRSVYDEEAKAFLERCNCMLYSPGDYVRSKHKIGEIPVSEWCSKREERVVDTKHLKDGISTLEINENPNSYVLHLDFFRFKNLLDLDLPKDSIFVRARCEPFNPRMELSEERMKRWLKHFGINAQIGHEPYQIHASGHASGPEIQEMIDEIRPKILVPVHTMRPDLFQNPAGKIIIPKRGLDLDLDF